jgi:hypothetical protein
MSDEKPPMKPFDEAQAYGHSDRAVRHVQAELDRVRQECITRLGAGQRVVLVADGVTVATFEPWR